MPVSLFQEIELYDVDDYVYAVKNTNIEDSSFSGMEICKTTKEIRATKIAKTVIENASRMQVIYGILGFIKLAKSFCMIVVESRIFVGMIMGHEIFSLDKVGFVSCDKISKNSFPEEDLKYLRMLQKHFETPGFYFSYTYDLTRTIDKGYDNTAKNIYSSLIEYNLRYMWNRHLFKRIIHIKEIYKYFLPIIYGYIGIIQFQKPSNFSMLLISRRSNERVGTRYFVRGADLNGNVVNYVESESIVLYESNIYSYVQVRGSIPLVWSQYPCLKYKPAIVINEKANQVSVAKKHFERELEERRREVVINLADSKGQEGLLVSYFGDSVEKLNLDEHKLSYIYFDFHTHCAKMRFDRVSILMEKIEDMRAKMGYHHLVVEKNSFKQTGQTMNRQFGVFRTNCIDCLDRTNVVQSMIAWKTLLSIFQQSGILTEENKQHLTNVEFYHKQIWADNADYLSIQYTGSPALKTDFTRYGVRTISGALNDGKNSLKRYVYSNFSDGFRQDGLDLVVGNFDFDTQRPDSYPKDLKNPASAILPILFLSLVMLLIGDVFLLSDSIKSRVVFAFLILWGMFATVKFILRNPNKYINLPNLISINKRQ